MSVFGHVEPYAGDPILSLNDAFQKDPRRDKINLSIGIYFDDAGRIPVLDCVQQAEAQMLAEGGAKPYLPIEGAKVRREHLERRRIRRRRPEFGHAGCASAASISARIDSGESVGA